MNASKKLTDGALLTAIYIVLLLIALFVPLIELVATFLLPIPFIIFAFRYDWKSSLLMFVATLFLSAIFGTIFSLPITILMGLGGIMLGGAMHSGLSAYEVWARGTIGFVGGLLLIFVFSQLLFQVNWIEEINLMLSQSMQTSQDLMNQLGLGNQTEEQLELIEEQMMSITELIPVGIAFIAIIMAFISQWFSYKIINRLENKNLHFPPFRTLKLPVSLIWIYFFALIFTFFELDPSSTLYLGVNNILMLVGMLLTIQGFSFIFFYAHHKNMSKLLPVGSIILTILFPFLLLYLVRLIGIIDMGFGMRERITQGKK
ncbi:YybS family protein [Virgibacillus byunsanensis]|uniref:YybS family protein n=1 Tax=Virgibacillus byunsanensis TaxID=570945 RepID=A0ABW3LPF5_9BACI